MSDLPRLLQGTALQRGPTLILFALVLASLVAKTGLVRAATLLGLAFVVAFAAELACVHAPPPWALDFSAIPSGDELWLGPVPLYSPLAIAAVIGLAFQLAVTLASPLERGQRDLQVLDTLSIRRSPRVLVTSVILATAMTALLDPVVQAGARWAFGAAHRFPGGGAWFGMPWTALVVSVLVALASVAGFQRLERFLAAPTPLLVLGQAHLRLAALHEPLLALALAGTVPPVALWLGEPTLAIAALLVIAPVAAMYGTHLASPADRAGPTDREAHRRDFPRSPALG